jgi:tripartite-type tricarboxylate transporter receptor subunit TctC
MTALPLVRAGKVRALGLSTRERIASAPDIPPLAEVGVAGFDASAWHMIVAPAGLPTGVLDTLNGELRAIVADGEVQREFSERGMIPLVTPSPDELRRFVKAEISRWGAVVTSAGLAHSQ